MQTHTAVVRSQFGVSFLACRCENVVHFLYRGVYVSGFFFRFISGYWSPRVILHLRLHKSQNIFGCKIKQKPWRCCFNLKTFSDSVTVLFGWKPVVSKSGQVVYFASALTLPILLIASPINQPLKSSNWAQRLYLKY